jgi:hypothetical protein
LEKWVSERKVVFIMGAGHCGSTLLDLILGSHSQAFSLAEFHVVSKFIDDPDGARQAICAICGDTCEFWNGKAPLPSLAPFYSQKSIGHKLLGRAVRAFRNPYAPMFAATGKSVLIDSSKSARWFARQIRYRYTWRNTSPYLIYLARDGRAVANSYFRKYPDLGIVSASERWKRSTVSMNRFYETYPFPNKTRVRYEDLATSTEAEVRRLCEFLGLGFEPAMLTYWIHDHHPISGNAGTHSLVIRQRERFGRTPPDHRSRVNEGDRFYSSDHYERLGLGIELDLRWKRELTDEALRTFEDIAGDLNAPFAYEPESPDALRVRTQR